MNNAERVGFLEGSSFGRTFGFGGRKIKNAG
jgi:hypothetical protein